MNSNCPETIRSRVVQLLASHGLLDQGAERQNPIAADGDIFRDLDSLQLVILAGAVETAFGVKISSVEINRETFQSVDTLVRLLERKTGVTSQEP